MSRPSCGGLPAEALHWTRLGVDVATWERDPETLGLDVTVRTDVEQARALLRARYGPDTTVRAAPS